MGGGRGVGRVERDQISDIRPPKIKYQTPPAPPPPQSNIRYHALAKNQISSLKKIRYQTPQKINYQISHPLNSQISDIKLPVPPPPPPYIYMGNHVYIYL